MAKFGKDSHHPNASSAAVQNQVRRLSRVAGQVNGVSRMVVEGRSPTDILTQLKAIRSAIDAVEEQVVRQAIADGLHRALEHSDRSSQMRSLEKLFGLAAQLSRAGDGASGTGRTSKVEAPQE